MPSSRATWVRVFYHYHYYYFCCCFRWRDCRTCAVRGYDYNWWGTKTEWYRVGCPFHLDGRTVALENLRSNCIVRDSGGHLRRYWRSWYIRFRSLAPGKQLVYTGATTTYFTPYSRNSVQDYIIIIEVSHTDDFEGADTPP